MDAELKKISAQLQDPFESDDLEWRVQRSGINRNSAWVAVVSYVTNRAIQQRLDDVVGFNNWKNEYKTSPDGAGVICGLSININNEWITKWDGAEKKPSSKTIDETKSALSNSMKRAAVQFGIGRYLYSLESKFATCEIVESRKAATHNYLLHKDKQNGVKSHVNWVTPELPEWAKPSADSNELISLIQESINLADLKINFSQAWLYAKSFGRTDLQKIFKTKYESTKLRLDIQAQENIESQLLSLSDNVERQIKSLSMVPEKSSVSVVCSTLRKHIQKMSEGQYYDATEIINRVNEAEKNRITEIENKQQEVIK